MRPVIEQYVLLEYSAYRMLNLLSPAGLRARLGSFDYADTNGRVTGSRIGFFVEDPDDAASRNGLKEIRTTGRIAVAQLDPAAAARAALFEYMIGNTDWSMRAGPQGEDLLPQFPAVRRGGQLRRRAMVPVPYDFDSSGLVNAPYAGPPPESLRAKPVRDRQYRGYCAHNAQALAAAAEFRAKQPQIVGVLWPPSRSSTKGVRSGAAAYLDSFFRDIATDEDVARSASLKTCIN